MRRDRSSPSRTSSALPWSKRMDTWMPGWSAVKAATAGVRCAAPKAGGTPTRMVPRGAAIAWRTSASIAS